ncbi:mitochondrial 37S ribosomal protein nam9 [Podochytrium sp. JEL0797]|nr:mitochondrial 37S ribosomal protein nam9 [Podochytrium sp. JEL0797]
MSKRIPSRWKVADPYAPHTALLRMSWDALNVFNLAHRTAAPDTSRRSVFQQKWAAKRELRAYHVPNITETQLLHRHWKNQLPLSHEKDQKIPVQALAFAETERRVDVVLFRSHFASSIFMARSLVTQGHVKVNGVKCLFPARALNAGDLVTVDPSKVVTLRPRPNVAPEASESKEPVESAESKEPVETKEPIESKAAESAESIASPTPVESAEPTTPVAADPTTPKQSPALALLLKKHPNSLPFHPLPYMAPFMFIPNYLEVCYNTTSTVFLRPPMPQPDSVEIPSPHAPDMHALAYEWYSSIKRAKTKRPPPAEPLVVNGQSVRLKSKFESIVRARLKGERDERWKVWGERDEAARVKAMAEKAKKVTKAEKVKA